MWDVRCVSRGGSAISRRRGFANGTKATSPETLGQDTWECLEAALIDGLRTYRALKRMVPPSGPFDLTEAFHLNGGYVAGRWCRKFFRSLALSFLLPHVG